ncbi:HTH-type transcriptional regulator ChbR [BD1-7 clade bacterium]|uniref:HTH-type transcriptional regulator ChbR n=1 Tax=BD1-7 clade bacterium TaxID=2029982 RepID=A0A5S9QJ22_9GAMM|nr:HTH-type transcriptional regulator ChbR [BD1-7 clade bacterium]CAA0117712.1 HTH-type transcriptional regulator ChbR [BD1-7 clade bacterium]
MGFQTTYILLIILDAQDFYISPRLYFLCLTVIFLAGPITLGYVSHISSRRSVSVVDFLPCLIPILLLLVAPDLISSRGLFEIATEADYNEPAYLALFNFLSLLAGIQVTLYLALATRMVLHMRADWEFYQSKTLPRSWHQTVEALGVIWIVTVLQVISAFLNPAGDSMSIGDIGFILQVIYFISIACKIALFQPAEIHIPARPSLFEAETDYGDASVLPNPAKSTASNKVTNTANVNSSTVPLPVNQPNEEVVKEFKKNEQAKKSTSAAEASEITLETKAPETDTSDQAFGDIGQAFTRIKDAVCDHRWYQQEDLSLVNLAALLETTTHKLSEIINKGSGQSFYEFINGLRISHAAQCLIERPDDTITDIYFDAGFTSKSTFYNTFKKQYGCTPTQYRKQHQATEPE